MSISGDLFDLGVDMTELNKIIEQYIGFIRFNPLSLVIPSRVAKGHSGKKA